MTISPGKKSYGSGHFGEWIEDEFGLPAYRYTCNQLDDPKAITPVLRAWRSPTDHSHQVGNDRLVGVASNYGYIQVRQDEGSPKYLNDYDPQAHQYAGGIGYLTDGQRSLNTFFTGNTENFERVFGVGYLRKMVRDDVYTVDQMIFAPFGDDPLLISQVTITNRSTAPRDVGWIEYWGCQPYQFSYRSYAEASLQGDASKAVHLRRDFGQRFEHYFLRVGNNDGLVETKKFLGRTESEEALWTAYQNRLIEQNFFRGAVKEPVPEASMEDLNPPPSFLVSLDAPADGLATDGAAFFGAGGVQNPAGLNTQLNNQIDTMGTASALLLERDVYLQPGQSVTLYFTYGYLPEGFELTTLLDKYHQNPSDLLGKSSAQWRADGVRLIVEGEPWVERELIWHNYYLRGNTTYDSFFQEHVLSQGHVYQYLMGFQGAARDPLQHAMPFLFSQPEFVAETIRYTLKEIQPDGELPWAIVGSGMVMPAPYRPSDQQMWLLWLASEYVLATRDKSLLDEIIPTYPIYGNNAGKVTVRDGLKSCFRQLVDDTGTGQHGLLRLSNGDWNDSAVLGHAPPEKEDEVRLVAESVLNAAMSIYVLDIYATMLDTTDDHELAVEARAFAAGQREAVRLQWAGRWFRRAWFTPEIGWLGDDQMWLEPQPWAIIGGAATLDQQQELLSSMDELVRKPSAIGAMLHSKGVAAMRHSPGILTNGGVWPSINGTLIWALALIDGDMAWDEWKKNSLAQHAEAYPDVWYGIWSGPDAYNSALSRYPGQTQFDERIVNKNADMKINWRQMNWTDFPVMNMHPHAWPLYSAAKLIGAEFTRDGMTLYPTLPLETYRFESPLVGLIKSESGYEGWYKPVVGGDWKINLRLPNGTALGFKTLMVNGAAQPISRQPNGSIDIIGSSTADEPLHWLLA